MLDAPSAPRRHFRRDPELPNSGTDADYRKSGFHRSHLVPARDPASSPAALGESYYLSNAVPQVAAHSDAVYILTGTLFDCDNIRRIGPNQIAVPCATFKVAKGWPGKARRGQDWPPQCAQHGQNLVG
ncbi:MAG: DNA/RNA non-specific endonuclease [Acidobacteria bacterium]|nr:DNA/RNA non-specific endonuclease [Acidobacteriota bacterium]